MKEKMKLTTGQYASILVLQTIIFWVDFSINAFGHFGKTKFAMIALLVVQLACIILALSSLLLTFFSTYVFQAGLIALLYERFRCTLIVCIIYFFLTLALHIWYMLERLETDLTMGQWSTGLQVMSGVQKVFSPIYYYYFKRTALRLSDPRFYVDMMWDKNFSDSGLQYQSQ